MVTDLVLSGKSKSKSAVYVGVENGSMSARLHFKPFERFSIKWSKVK